MEGWRDEGVKDALDLCLGCKGCKGDCPVSVDLATYKAEFLSHYWDGKVRPRHAYAFGLVDVWARLGSPVAGLANLVTQTPGLSELAKAAAGVAPQRSIPPLAPRSFQQWFRKRRPPYIPLARQVVLWPDTFNNYFHPDIAQATVEVLENAGFEVRVPDQPVCCGRPLYDFGMLDRAQAYLKRVIATLQEEIQAGIPVVVLEPSCASVFRDEMRNLLPHDHDARRFSQQVFLLGEFLDKHAPRYSPPPFEPKSKALLHGHCHQKALMGMDPDVKWLNKLDLDVELIDSGCCGMAGSFGFEKEKYEVSVKCGEHVLLGAVRGEDAATWIVANGFSCQEQISQLTKRHAVHLAQLMALAVKQKSSSSDGRSKSYPERSIIEQRERAVRESVLHAGAGLGAALAVGAGLLWAAKRTA